MIGIVPVELASLVLDHLPGAVIGVDLEGHVTTWNRAAERMFGWSAADLVGRPLPIVPDESTERRQRWLERVAQGEDVEVTTQRRHRDGHMLDVVIRYAAVRDEGGEVVGWVGVCRDASSQLRTATRLQRSQAELALVRKLAGMVQGLLQDLDLASVLQAIVEAGVELAQAGAGAVSLEDHAGGFYRVVNVNIPSDLTSHPVQSGQGLHGEVLRTGAPVNLDDYDTWEGAVPAFRDRGFHASLAVPIFRGSTVIGVLAVHALAPRRRFPAEALDVLIVLAEFASVAIGNATVYRQVSSEREKFLALVQAMPDGLAVVENGLVAAWNAAAARLTGRPANEVIGQPPPFDLDDAAFGVEVEGRDGHRWLQTVGSELPDADARVYLIRDVTEQRDLDRAKDLFFATTSHELKTPLTVVKGLASTLRKHWERMDPAQRDDALETIERRAEALDRLIERILVGSRVQAGAFTISPTPVDIARLIDDVVPGFAAAASPNHEVRAEVPERLPLVAGDRQAIDTILGHLLENAIKYSPGGGEVVVSAAVDDDGGRMIVQVSDRGIGIEGDVERLLDPFVQADSRMTRRFGGVGLGLYIVRQLLDQLDGRFWAANRGEGDGGGSVFGFSLPMWKG
ncbi:MAG: two-component system, NtrC family, sensor histidine kinase KinB [Actinomycetota bacterium]|jgi:PAS domain S-box-containing protein|nr:two-component system, NtrC family, sensor histidine kinase KinB [Actinomycetota bacterium]